MAKFSGMVGFVETSETSPGVWPEKATEKRYTGDITRDSKRWTGSIGGSTDTLTTNTIVSVIIDSYANQHFPNIRYVAWMGTRWTVVNIDVQRPRLILTLGGIYNGQPPEVTNPT